MPEATVTTSAFARIRYGAMNVKIAVPAVSGSSTSTNFAFSSPSGCFVTGHHCEKSAQATLTVFGLVDDFFVAQCA